MRIFHQLSVNGNRMLLLMDNTQIQELIKSYLDDVSDLDFSGRDCNFSIKIVSKDFIFGPDCTKFSELLKNSN